MTRKNPNKRKIKPKEEKNSFLKFSSILLAFTGLFVPAFYLLGLRFYQGILSAYGVNINSFPLEPIGVYEYGYYAIVYAFNDYFGFFGKVISSEILLAFIIILIPLLYSVFKYKGKLEFLRQHRLKREIEDTIKWIIILIYFPLTILSVFVIIGLFWIYIPNWAHTKGQEIQAKSIREYHVFGCEHTKNDWSICTQVLDKNNTQVYEGLLIGMKGDRVAFYRENGSEVFTLKLDQRLYRPKILELNKKE